jgi:polyisoprenoid-binding protein YceI
MRRNTGAVVSLVSTLACGALACAQPPAPPTALEVKANGLKTFYADSRAGNNQVTVESQSTLEDFTCVCNRVTGQCQLDPQKVETFAGKFSIRVESIKTGIDLRDEHLRGPEWLNAAEFPDVVVTVEKVEDVKKTAPNAVSLVLVGTCSLHGKTNPVHIPATLAYLDETPETMHRVKGDLVRIRAAFDVKLADYGILGPPGSGTIGLKVGETVAVKVTIFGSTERPPDELKADKPATTGPAAPIRPKPPEPQPPKG